MEGPVTVPVCPNCHRQVPYRQVSTNVNGNQGRLLAKVKSYIDRIHTCRSHDIPVQPVEFHFMRVLFLV
jgi:hypothetical protein